MRDLVFKNNYCSNIFSEKIIPNYRYINGLKLESSICHVTGNLRTFSGLLQPTDA